MVLVRVLHGIIIGTLALESLYAGFQVFIVLQPEGMVGPLLFGATEVPLELLIVRRMYAIEAWLAFAALAIYLGLTEVLPRRLLLDRALQRPLQRPPVLEQDPGSNGILPLPLTERAEEPELPCPPADPAPGAGTATRSQIVGARRPDDALRRS
ncbi:MAG TPA: hypothetical protein ENK18_03715 [Deltaproteobacteria bacterium]|nr:hypothetical protein [Deltaproteobacteria bacterium]